MVSASATISCDIRLIKVTTYDKDMLKRPVSVKIISEKKKLFCDKALISHLPLLLPGLNCFLMAEMEMSPFKPLTSFVARFELLLDG